MSTGWVPTPIATATVYPAATSVRVVYNNDPHEKLQAMPHVVSAFRALSKEGEAQGRDVLRLNGGDNNIGVEAHEWDLSVAMNNLVGFHAAALGNHEFDLGSQFLTRGLRQANYPTLVANLEEPKTGMAERVKEGKIKTQPLVIRGKQATYGVIGLTTPRLHDVLNPKVELEGNDVEEDWDDIVEIAQNQVKALQTQGVNKIFLVSHMDTEHDKRLVSEVPGIDVVISAHDHKIFDGIVPGKNLVTSAAGEPVLLVEGGKNAEWVGSLDILFDGYGRLIPQQNRLVNPFQFSADPHATALKNAVLGVPKPLAVVTTPYNSTHNAFSPDAVAQLTADAMRAVSGADIAFVRSPEIRSNIQAGVLTDQLSRELMPFTDPVVRLYLSGQEVLNALNLSAQCLAKQETHPGMLHPSGMVVFMNQHTGRVGAAYVLNRQTLQWEPLNNKRVYSVALGEFTALNKGEFKSLAQPERIDWRSGVPVRGFFEWALQHVGAPSRPVGFRDDGRLKILA